MSFCRKTILLLIFSSFMSVGWGQDCDEGVEVELWGECYNIEETTYLDLSHSGLTGGIPPEIGNLTNLRGLELSGNQLNGDIPPEIGNLTNLTDYLSLGFNQLSGEIPPEIGNLTNLTDFLSLHFNQLTGEIPSEIGNLTNLTELGLDNNQLSGEIPSEIGNLDNLELLWLSNNQFGGFIPESICDLSILWDQYNEWGDPTFHINNNSLCPPYPECIEDYVGYQDTSGCEEEPLCDEGYTEIDGECYYQSDLDVVQDFIDSNESLNGYSPITLTSPNNWLNGHLKTFLLYDRGITSIPESIGNLDSLDMIYFFENEIESVPESIGSLINLTFLDLGRNNISNIPDTIWDLVNLTTLNFQENQLTSISDEICNIYSNLEYEPFLSMNQICPPYPECLTEENIGYQDTSECFLCEDGYIDLWGECYTITFTTYLDLSEMGLSGEIPSEIGDLTNLTNLDLGGNQLSGEIPYEICNLNNLSVLDLGGNQLSGEIPSEICNLTNLTELELGGNQFSGEIPSCVGNLNNLTFLHLEYNQLSGEIPSEIGNLTNLFWLNIVHNQLSGEIPSSICNLNMNWSDPNNFNIYENQFCPPYPECIGDNIGYQDTSECSLCDEGYTEINGECYYQSDLDVLQDIIDNSQGGDNPPPSDLSPIELCGQVWIYGRLVNLYCSGDDLEQDESYIDFELDIPESIGNLTSLMSFGLEYNNLSSLPESFGNLSNLVGVLLHHNQLTSLPESFGNLTNLTGLDVDNNQLTSLPESFGNLTNLSRLLLPVNQLTSLPDNIGNLTKLTELYLFSNNLTSIPESIGNLISLEELWLSDNLLSYIPESICDIPEECNILVHNNQLCEEYHYDCIDGWGEQECVEYQIGDECVTQDGWIGFYDCELCCWDEWIIENWLGDGWCDYLGGCGFEGPLFNCPELGYDCGDCTEDWDGTDPSGLCSDDCLLPGDVNNDSILNILDIVSMITLILDGEYNECGDVNSDGDLNILDVITFVNIILSIP